MNTTDGIIDGILDDDKKPYDESEFRKLIAQAITKEGVATTWEDSNAVFIENIEKILQERTKDATATQEDIITGKTAYVNGEKITGIATTIKDPQTITQGNVKVLYSRVDYGNISSTYEFKEDYDLVFVTAQGCNPHSTSGYKSYATISTSTQNRYVLNNYTYSGSGQYQQKCAFGILKNVKRGDTIKFSVSQTAAAMIYTVTN